MIAKYLSDPTIGDLYIWDKEKIRICISDTDEKWITFFKNSEKCIIDKNKFAYMIFSMSEDYVFLNVNEE